MRDLGGSNPRHLQPFTGEAGARPRGPRHERDCGSNGVSGPITLSLAAWRERCRDDRDTG